MQNLVSCHFASQVESGMEEHWEWENLGSKKKKGLSTDSLNCRENFHVKTFLEQNCTDNIEMKENRGVGELLYSDTFLSGFVAIGSCRLLTKSIY